MTAVMRRLTVALFCAVSFHIMLLALHLKDSHTPPVPVPAHHIRVTLARANTVRPRQMKKQNPQRKIQTAPILQTSRKKTETKKTISRPRKIVTRHRKKHIQSPPPQAIKQTPLVQLNKPHKTNKTTALPQTAAPAQTAPQIQDQDQAQHQTQSVQQAIPIYQVNPPPEYPGIARRRGEEGVVLLEALIDTNGKVAQLRVFCSSGHTSLDKAALKTVKRWRFTPGTRKGRKEQMWVKVPVRFRLQQKIIER